mmetsp:Transcript_26211/g.41962  ORF Transcript_26211/g.41962 Transcript_26211/m.41962 type:complete len:168 (-) Transcript_26211:469-972(-)
MAMKYMGAYLMAVLGGKESPTAADVKVILEAGGLTIDQEMLDRVIAKMDGKQAHELIAAGYGKFAACGGGGGGGGGMRAPSDLGPFQDVDSSTWLTGKVARIASFGAFVTVTSGDATADGLVHITQIKDGYVESVQDELSEGQEVQVRVQSVDMGAGKMSLTMKSEE